jgi:hypothetical protein
VLSRNRDSLSPDILLVIRTMIVNGVFIALLALFPWVLTSGTLPPTEVWRWSSGAFVFGVLFVVWPVYIREQRALGPLQGHRPLAAGSRDVGSGGPHGACSCGQPIRMAPPSLILRVLSGTLARIERPRNCVRLPHLPPASISVPPLRWRQSLEVDRSGPVAALLVKTR